MKTISQKPRRKQRGIKFETPQGTGHLVYASLRSALNMRHRRIASLAAVIARGNKLAVFCIALLCTAILTACGEDEALTAYQEDMNTFFEHIATFNDNMNSIDASSEDAADKLLSYLDQLQAEFTWMASLEVPDRFSAVDSLADEADENMKQAVSLYHQAYEAEVFDEGRAQAAKEYYDRANVRIQYIISILHGEIPEGDGVTYTEENSILGGGYLNHTDEEEPEGSEDNFDTDDTVFYEEEPTGDSTQESTQQDE